MAIFRNGQAVARAWGVYPTSHSGDPLRRVIATSAVGLDGVLLTSETREVLCELLECEHVVIDFTGAGGRQRRRCRQCGGGRVDKATKAAAQAARLLGRKITTEHEYAARAPRYEAERLQAEYDKTRAAAEYARGEPARRRAALNVERQRRQLQYQWCSVCGAQAGTACIESSRRHLGVVADQVHPGRRLLDPRKSLPKGAL